MRAAKDRHPILGHREAVRPFGDHAIDVERHLGLTDPIVLVVGDDGSITRIEIIQHDLLGWGGDRHDRRSGFLLVGWWLGGSSSGCGGLVHLRHFFGCGFVCVGDFVGVGVIVGDVAPFAVCGFARGGEGGLLANVL